MVTPHDVWVCPLFAQTGIVGTRDFPHIWVCAHCGECVCVHVCVCVCVVCMCVHVCACACGIVCCVHEMPSLLSQAERSHIKNDEGTEYEMLQESQADQPEKTSAYYNNPKCMPGVEEVRAPKVCVEEAIALRHAHIMCL